MKARVFSALKAKARRRRIDSWIVQEKWLGEHNGVKIVKDDIPYFKRKPETRPLELVENLAENKVAFVRAESRAIRPEVNTALLKELKERRGHTFVLDSSLACMFGPLTVDEPPKSAHRKHFLELLQSVQLSAPPIAQREYAEFGLLSTIPTLTLTQEEEDKSQKIAKSLIWLFKNSPKALWMALKKQHKRRLRDYLYVVQSAMLYPKTTILTNDRDFNIFDTMMDEIEKHIYRKYRTEFVNLRSVCCVNVMDDLGLDVNSAGYFWPRSAMRKQFV